MLFFQKSCSALGVLAGFTIVLACANRCSAGNREDNDQKSNANKESAKLCDDKLDKLRADNNLSREKVTNLFEQALENIAKANDYIEQIRASAKQETIENYDRNGGLFVLKISDKRREFLAASSDLAAGDDDDDERLELLESYYKMACGFEQTTGMSLEAMRKSARIKAAANKV